MILMAVIVVSAYSVLAVCAMIMTFLALYGKILLSVVGIITLVVFALGFLLTHGILAVMSAGDIDTTKGRVLRVLGFALNMLRLLCAVFAFGGLALLLTSWFIL